MPEIPIYVLITQDDTRVIGATIRENSRGHTPHKKETIICIESL